MRKLLLLIFSAAFFLSCKKDAMDKPAEEPMLSFSEANYKVTVTLNWRNPQFTVPANVHITALKCLVHARDTFLWNPGSAASKGLEYVAEDGYDGFINDELEGILSHGKGLSKITLPPFAVTGTMDTTLVFNTNFSCFSFASMIAPSPDWFMGVNSIDLVRDNKWVMDITVPVLLYDAGTEDGDAFAYDNPPTSPKQSVALLTPANASVLANGNSSLAAIGSIRLLKIN